MYLRASCIITEERKPKQTKDSLTGWRLKRLVEEGDYSDKRRHPSSSNSRMRSVAPRRAASHGRRRCRGPPHPSSAKQWVECVFNAYRRVKARHRRTRRRPSTASVHAGLCFESPRQTTVTDTFPRFFRQSGVSLSKHIAVEYIYISTGAAGKKEGYAGVAKRRMASATAGRAASSPSNGRRRNDGPWSETEREKETAGRRFQRPAGANLDAKPWSVAGDADTVAATGRPTTRRRRRRRRRRPRRRPMQEYFFCWQRGTVTTGVGRCSSVAKPEGALSYSISSPSRTDTRLCSNGVIVFQIINTNIWGKAGRSDT